MLQPRLGIRRHISRLFSPRLLPLRRLLWLSIVDADYAADISSLIFFDTPAIFAADYSPASAIFARRFAFAAPPISID